MRWTDLPVDRPVATIMLLVALTVVGIVGALQLPLDFWPLVQEPEIDISVPYPGSHPLEGLREIARPIEEELAAIPGIKSIEARVNSNRVNLEANFDASTDIELKKMEVREAVERARPHLPDDVGFIRVEGNIDGGIGDGGGNAILEGRISADRDLSESWELLDRRIRRPLERIRGVARVRLYGVERQEVRVDLDLPALRRHGIDPALLLATINGANLDLDLGKVRGDVIRYSVRSLGRFRDVAALADLRIGGGDIRVRDVARVELREPRLVYGRHLDRRFAIGIDVYAEPSSNTVEVNDALMAKIGEIERDPELAGIQLLVWESAGEQIRTAIFGLRNAGIFGGLLAITVLFLFLRRLRTTLVIAVAIPFSVIVTCGAMFLLGQELNVLSMLGLMLGVGMMVDNAVVVLENIHRLEGQGVPVRQAARRGVREVALAVTAATATTLLVWSWLLLEDASEMVAQVSAVAVPICLAVAASLLISLTFIPLAASRFAPRKEVKPGFLLTRMVPAYRRLLGFTFRHRVLTLVCLLALAASATVPIVSIEKVGEPKTLPRYVQIFYEVHDASTKEVLEGYVDQVESWVESRHAELQYEGLYSWYDESGPNAITRLYPPDRLRTEKGIERLRESLRQGLPVIPGVKLSVTDNEWFRHGRGGAQGRRMVNMSLHGEDPEHLERLALAVEQRLQAQPDVIEVMGPGARGTREMLIRVDTERAHALGLSPEEIAAAVGFGFRGQRLRRFEHHGNELELIVGLPEEARPGLVAMADYPIPVEGGGIVPLSSVAAFELARTPPTIRRVDRVTTAWVSVEFDEEAVGNTPEAIARVEQAMEGFRFPEGYGWGWGQWGRQHSDALDTMMRGVLLSLLIVVLLMMALFESVLQPLAIVITLPLAFFGAFWSLWLGGFVLDPVAFFGVILLIGIVVNNGIVMVNHVNDLRRSGTPRVEALVQGCGDRLRPVLMTAITTIFGILPLGMSAFNVRGAPMGSLSAAIAGGLASSTIFTLIGLPVWYTVVEDAGSLAARVFPLRIRTPQPK